MTPANPHKEPSTMSADPRWRQIVDDLAAQIDSGGYPPGSQLPSLPKLREQYAVSTTTVQKALDVLEYVGMIEPRHGIGFFVVGPNPHRKSSTS
jgi:GntR family transcriptional regulator